MPNIGVSDHTRLFAQADEGRRIRRRDFTALLGGAALSFSAAGVARPAILDRIIHNAHRLQLRGDSLRKQKAPKIAAA